MSAIPARMRPMPDDASPDAIAGRAGIGLRFRHHRAVLDERPAVAWFEVHTENYMGGGAAPRVLDAIRRDYPVSLHGVGLSVGSADGIDAAHLARVRDAVARYEPALVSEHLSWSTVGGAYLADLLPLPMTEEALGVVSRHVDQVQTALGRRLLVENPSTYLRFAHSTIPEWEFLAELARRTGCGILCDVNNVYVSACNHGWNPLTYLAALPPAAIGEIHLAGHRAMRLDGGRVLRIDDHGSRVAPAVWALYRVALRRFGAVSTLIEWDTDVPPVDTLMQEAAIAESALEEVRHESANADAG
ncbi:MNIO family bufferin maturase [Burkholderia oklahomensis]|uniref:MNIO family bufferin maturase n=1 Tax=Burkholderia oklahomensis TaxID=342113 RepID=UPI003F50F4F6